MAATASRGSPRVARAVERVREAVDRLRLAGVRVERAILFGSAARGEAGPWSDIDLALVVQDYREDDMGQWLRIVRICQDVDRRIEPVVYAPGDLRDEEPLASQIMSTGTDVLHCRSQHGRA